MLPPKPCSCDGGGGSLGTEASAGVPREKGSHSDGSAAPSADRTASDDLLVHSQAPGHPGIIIITKVYHVPGLVLSPLHVLMHVILIINEVLRLTGWTRRKH